MKRVILAGIFCLSFINEVQASLNRLSKPAVVAGGAVGAGALAWYTQSDEQNNAKYNSSVSTIKSQQPRQSSFIKDVTPKIEQSIHQAVIKLLNLEEDATIEGKTFQDLTTQAQRIAFLQRDLRAEKVADDVDLRLIEHYISIVDNTLYKLFMTKLHEYANIYGAGVITMNCVDRAFAYITLYAGNVVAGLFNFNLETMHDIDMLMQAAECTNKIKHRLNPALKKEYAFHEVAHALILILKQTNQNLSLLSIQGLGFVGAAIFPVPQDPRNKIVKNEKQASMQMFEKLAMTENNIMMFFAGSIGQQMYRNEKLSLQAMLSDKKYSSGAGNRYEVGTDVYKAYKEAEDYCRFKNNSLAAEWEKDLEPFLIDTQDFEKEVFALLEQCYNQAWTILESQKELLEKIVNKALEDEVVSGDVMYKMAGVKRPKYEFEKTPLEKAAESIARWVSWTLRRASFYERHHPQA